MFKLKSIYKFEIISTIILIISGTILHFVYEWSGENLIVGLFTPINESIWEHLKLFFFPMTVSTIIGYIYEGKNIDNYLCAKLNGIITSMSFTVIAFYTYSGILENNIGSVNIIIFIIAVIFGQYIVLKKLKKEKCCDNKDVIITFITLTIIFFIFTFSPPNIGLFKDPITGLYGVKK